MQETGVHLWSQAYTYTYILVRRKYNQAPVMNIIELCKEIRKRGFHFLVKWASEGLNNVVGGFSSIN